MHVSGVVLPITNTNAELAAFQGCRCLMLGSRDSVWSVRGRREPDNAYPNFDVAAFGGDWIVFGRMFSDFSNHASAKPMRHLRQRLRWSWSRMSNV